MNSEVAEVGTDLYRRAIKYDYQDEGRSGLVEKFWSQTPWMVDAYTGSSMDWRSLEMMHWCKEHFGEENWPLHDIPGDWKRGGVTMNGWTWYGFKTEAMLQEFLTAWPTPEGAEK